MNIYSWSLSSVISMMLLSILEIAFSAVWIPEKRKGRLILVVAATTLSLAGLYAILLFTVITRTATDMHVF